MCSHPSRIARPVASGVAKVAGRDQPGLALADEDLAASVGTSCRAVVGAHSDLEPRRRHAHGAETRIRVDARQARCLGHAVVFPDLHPEPLLERTPDIGRRAAAPCDPHRMVAIVGPWRPGEQHLENSAQEVDLGRPRPAHVAPEPRGAEPASENDGDLVLQGQHQHLDAADVIQRLPQIHHVPGPHVRCHRAGCAAGAKHLVGDQHPLRGACRP